MTKQQALFDMFRSVFAKSPFLSGAFLFFITLLVYYPATQAGFVWDDIIFIAEDPLITDPNGLKKIWLEPGGGGWNYWPLTRSLFWMQHEMWGLAPQGYHWVNLLFHAINVGIFWLALRSFQIRGAWWCAALFALHPLFVSTAAWAVELKNTFSNCFYLLALWSYLHADRSRQHRWYILAFLLFAAALLSKSSTVMLPAILIVCRLWFCSSWNRWEVLKLVPFFGLSLVSAAISLGFESKYVEDHISGFPASFGERLLIAGHVPFFYLEKFLTPHSYAVIYPKWSISTETISQYMPLFSWLIIGSICLWKYFLWQKHLPWQKKPRMQNNLSGQNNLLGQKQPLGQSWQVPSVANQESFMLWGRPIGLGLAGFLISLFPVLGFFNVAGFTITYVWLHLSYLPSLPLVILVVQIGYWVRDQLQKQLPQALIRLPGIAGGVILISLGVLTWHQAGLYFDEETLWTDTIQKGSTSWLPYHNLALVIQEEDPQRSVELLTQSLELNPNRAATYYNRGGAYLDTEDYLSAAKDLTQAIKLDPEEALYYNNRAIAWGKLQEFERSIHDYSRAIEIEPTNATFWNNRANAFFQQGNYLFAIPDYTEAMKLDSNLWPSYKNRATAYLNSGHYESAIDDVNFYLEYRPNDPGSFEIRGAARLKLKQFDRAIQDFTTLLKLRPKYEKALLSVAAATYQEGVRYVEKGQYDKAFENFDRALTWNPFLISAYSARAFLHFEISKNSELACKDWQTACDLAGHCWNLEKYQQAGICPHINQEPDGNPSNPNHPNN